MAMQDKAMREEATPEGRSACEPRLGVRRLLALLALVATALGAHALFRRRQAPTPLPPQDWGRGHHYRWRGDEVQFQQLGEGPPVVLVHSLGPGHDGAEWHRVAELLADRHEVIAPDLPGWGRSAATLVDPRPRLYVDFLADFLAEVVRRPALLVAAGWAAPFALTAATALGGQLVRGIGLVTPRGLGEPLPDPRGALVQQVGRLPGVDELTVQRHTSRRAIRRHLEREVFAAPERADASRRERFYRSARQPGARRALLAFLGGRLAMDVGALLPQVTAPVWLAWGRLAAAPSVEAADLWLQRLPGADLEVFEGSGALPHLEVPVAFARKLGAFAHRLPA
jgi:pimeloyl-ACP methyl ester carboxylesterase